MRISRLNWPLWLGFLVSVVDFLSYPLLLVYLPTTWVYPWVNLLLSVLAIGLLVVGVGRAFSAGEPTRSKVAGLVIPILCAILLGFFILMVYIFA